MLKVGDLEATSKGRYYLNTEIIPRVASKLQNGDKVLFVGTDTSWDYKPFFWNPAKQCPFQTLDKNETYKPDLVGDIQNCPQIGDGEYSLVILIGVYEFLDYKEEAFKEIKRILKPGGYLLAALPGKGYYPDHRGVNLKEAIDAVGNFQVTELFAFYGNDEQPTSICILGVKK